MKIEKIHIYGFGKWNDEWFEVPSSLQIITGPNESGKTSIKQFILYVLFDLPAAKKKIYAPKHGKILGGRLFIRTGQGKTVIVERTAEQKEVRCFLDNGTIKGESYLNLLLKGMDRQTYEDIFAFGDRDLAKIREIKGEDLGKVLFGIGLTGSERIFMLERSLEKKCGEWFKKRGKNPIINEHLRRMKEMQNRINQYEQQEQDYQEIIQNISELVKRANEMQRKKDELEHEQLTLNAYRQVKEAIQQYKLLSAELTNYQDVSNFPHNGLSRLSDLKNQSFPLISELRGLLQNIKETEQEIHDYKRKKLSDDIFKQLSDIEQMVSDYEQLKREWETKMKEWESGRKSLEKELELTGLPLTIEEIHSLNLSVYTKHQWKDICRAREQLFQESEQIDQDIEQLEREKTNIEESLASLRQNMIPSWELNEIEKKLEMHQAEEVKKQLMNEQEQQIKHVQLLQDKLNKSRKIAITISPGFLLLSVFLFFSLESQTGVFMTSSLFFISLLVSFVLGLIVKQLGNQGKTVIPKHSEKEVLSETELTVLKEKRKQHQHITVKIEQHEARLINLTAELNQLEGKQHTLNRRRYRLKQQLKEEMGKYPFLKGIDVSHWPSVYQELEKIQRYTGNLDEKKAEIIRLEEELNQIQTKISQLGSQLNLVTTDSETCLKQLLTLYRNELNLRENIYREEQRLKTMTKKAEEIKQKLKPYEQEVQQLLHMAGVEDEQDFQRMGRKYDEKQKLKEKQDYWYRQIQAVFEGQAPEMIKETIDWDELEYRRQNIQDEHDRLAKEIQEISQEIADFRARKKQLEESETLSEKRHELSLLKNELKKYARQWAVLKTASSLIDRTKRVYQEEYLPEVIERTSLFFEQLTRGNYIRVHQPEPAGTIEVEDRNHVRFHVMELSEGTAAQLYVSLRLALSVVLNEDFNLPFLIDDAFVHFDRYREEEMYAILNKLTSRQQLLYFTCHDPKLTSFEEKSIINLEKQTFSL